MGLPETAPCPKVGLNAGACSVTSCIETVVEHSGKNSVGASAEGTARAHAGPDTRRAMATG